jgi:hypothetical protein
MRFFQWERMIMKGESKSERVANFMRFEYIPGSLDPKTRELVLLAAAGVAACDH